MKKHIPIFFACDERYLPYLAVSVKSISDHASDSYVYDVRVLSDGISPEGLATLRQLECERVRIYYVPMAEKLKGIRTRLESRLRDYYSLSIYYRMFIPSMFPELDRAIYIDCDTVLNTDIAELFTVELGDALLGAVADESIPGVPEFSEYVEKWVGVPKERYFNSGVLVMNLEGLRESGFEDRFSELLMRYNFDTVAPDQDYLNYICMGRVHYLDAVWNKQPIPNNLLAPDRVKLFHYNMFNKPWHYDGVAYEEAFWSVASQSPFAKFISEEKLSYTDVERHKDIEGGRRLIEKAGALAKSSGGFRESLHILK